MLRSCKLRFRDALLASIVSLLLYVSGFSVAQAQSDNTAPAETGAETPAATATETSTALEADGFQTQIEQLNDLVKSLDQKIVIRDRVRAVIAEAAEDAIPELQTTLDDVNDDIRETRQAIEQVSVGTVDLSIFEVEESALNWQTELTQITMPLIQNMKRLTEKPRRIEAARIKIEQASEQKESAETAASNISSLMEQIEDEQTLTTLDSLRQSWLEKVQESDREINLATVQLNNLQRSDEPIWVVVSNAVISFFKGRGLTILIAVVVAMVVYQLAKIVASLISKRQKGEDKNQYRTRERIIHYGLQAVRALLILISVLVVFYLRGDILLMGIAFLITAGLILSLRHTLPKFIEELQVLLNLGSVREDERIMYHGLPWKVAQLNMYSILTNPEITGVLRVPMHEMMNLTSRPSGKEPWFPASKNEYVLLDDGRLLKVVKITPEHVLFESLAGTQTMIPTAEVYEMVFENLSRSPSFLVGTVFGIGYSHQEDSVSSIPAKLKAAIEKALEANPDYAEHVESVSAELQEAGASSLDFWLGVKMKSEAATSYFRVKRLMQQVCVDTCTKENWDIPFPQLTLHNS